MPEIHYVGQVLSGRNITTDHTEGAFCRWRLEHGKAWNHLGGDLQGQTQVAYCSINEREQLPFGHPIDIHFAAAGLQGWGAPRVTVQCYRLDWHGRRILAGYGFAHMPIAPGPHRLEVHLWRPIGTPEQELVSFLLGHAPALITPDPIYESAWKERCRLLTVAAGSVCIDVFVVTRHMKKQGMDGN
ncbi:putative B9 domain-containing protein [Ochromonadaceae sp. CCMP2298]|nr:putative B9 domain-containing protein [Ochromonadaceae sp. CCMP2298]